MKKIFILLFMLFSSNVFANDCNTTFGNFSTMVDNSPKYPVRWIIPGAVYELVPDVCSYNSVDTLTLFAIHVISTPEYKADINDIFMPFNDPFECTDKYVLCVRIEDNEKCYTAEFFINDMGLNKGD